MADEVDLEKLLLSSDKRFEVYVPKPPARFQLGAKARKKDPEGPFGYPGATLMVKDHILVEAGANMVVQSKGDTNFLHAGKTNSFSKDTWNLTSGGDLLLSGNQNVLVVSGSANEPAPRGPAGDPLRVQAYNSLGLHYRVDALQNGLFEFFHGRRDRPIKTKKLPWAKKASKRLSKFDRKKTKDELWDAHKDLNKDPIAAADLKGGWTQNTLRTMRLLYPTEKQGEIFFTKSQAFYPLTRKQAGKKAGKLTQKPPLITWTELDELDPGDPVRWLEPLFVHDPMAPGGKNVPAELPFGTDDIDHLKHGFSKYYERFDPYHLLKVSAFRPTGPTKVVVMMKNTLTRMRRVLDVLAQSTGFLTGNVIWATFVGPAIDAVDNAMGALGVIAHRVDTIRKPAKEAAEANAAKDGQGEQDALAELPFVEQALGLVTIETQTDDRQASILSADETWDLSAGGMLTIDNESGRRLTYPFSTGVVPPAPAVFAFSADGLGPILDEHGQSTPDSQLVQLSIEIGGRTHGFVFDEHNAPDAAAIALLLGAAFGTDAVVTEHEDVITITTTDVGPDAHVRVVHIEDNDPGDAPILVDEGDVAYGRGSAPPIADPTKVTAAELVARLPPTSGIEISESGKGIRVSSAKRGAGSTIQVGGEIADVVFAQTKRDEVKTKALPDWEQPEGLSGLLEPINAFMELGKSFPDKLTAFFEPLTNALADVQETMTKLEGAVESAATLAGGLMLPEPAEAVGIFGTQGITLGTHDRIVGQGARGVLFVVDGGTGQADREKFVAGEKLLKILNPGNISPPVPVKKKASLGFRVLSDTIVDLTGNRSAQLLAMGRGKPKDKRPDGKAVGGVGVARVLSSFATEVAAYEKVVISARSAGESSDADGLTGGRVEVAAQTIAIGGVRYEDKDGNNAEYGPYDFDETRTGDELHSKSFGIYPFELEGVALQEHMHLQPTPKYKRVWNPGTNKFEFKMVGGAKEVKKPTKHLKMGMYAWPEKLRKEHPVTKRVHVHSSKETVIVVGPYMVHISAADGVKIGMRKANKDPSINEIDNDFSGFELTKDGYTFRHGYENKGYASGLIVGDNDTQLIGSDGSGESGKVVLKEKEAELMGGTSTSVKVSDAKGIELKATNIDATADSALKIKGGQIHIG